MCQDPERYAAGVTDRCAIEAAIAKANFAAERRAYQAV